MHCRPWLQGLHRTFQNWPAFGRRFAHQSRPQEDFAAALAVLNPSLWQPTCLAKKIVNVNVKVSRTRQALALCDANGMCHKPCWLLVDINKLPPIPMLLPSGLQSDTAAPAD